MPTEEAWTLIKRAVKERDIDDVKEAIQVYVKSAPDTTYADLERAFRAQDVPVWLIAIEKTLAATFTNMDLQGCLGKKYTVTYRFQWNPPRPRDRELWPKDVNENIERLSDAGEVVYGGLPKCSNCDGLGHISKSCPQDKVEKANTFEILCFNCNEPGHRVRDCKLLPPMLEYVLLADRLQGPTPRVDRFACKNCGFVTPQKDTMWDADNFPANRDIKSRTALSLAQPRMLSAGSATRVSFCFRPTKELLTTASRPFLSRLPAGRSQRLPQLWPGGPYVP